jgi:uncharacterized protein (TIGR03437 family)
MNLREEQSRVSFKVLAQRLAARQSSRLSLQAGDEFINTEIAIIPLGTPVLELPGRQIAPAGQEISFRVSAPDPGGLAVILAARNLPPGSSFDTATGLFSWIPTAKQTGDYRPTFAATNSSAATSVDSVEIRVDLPSGTGLRVEVEDRNGTSDLLKSTMRKSEPALFSLDGSGRAGYIRLAGTPWFATSRTYQALGQPAQAGDMIAIRAAGIESSDEVMVQIGEVAVMPDSVNAVPDSPGSVDVLVRIPEGVAAGDAVPVRITVGVTASNTVTMALESRD